MNLNNKIPAYLVSKSNSIRLIIFTASFALLFINIYSPFDVKSWFNLQLRSEDLFLYSNLIILTGVLVAVVSRVILFHYNKKEIRTKLWAFLLIIAAEIFSMALFYTIYESVFIGDKSRHIVDVFKSSIQNTALILLLPYAVLWLYFSWLDKDFKIKKLIAGDTPSPTHDNNKMIPFKDEKGTMRISLKLENIIYFKGSDNYVSIYYLGKNSNISKFMLRNTIKNLETQIQDLPITRCHRSYMINYEKIKTIRRERSGHLLEMDTDPAIEIPLSPTYSNEVFRSFGGIS